MYKSKLQELCQRQSWELPEYTAVKDGPDHMPRFTATVNVQGQLFETPATCKSSKEAQNTAAQIAFNNLTSPPPAAAPSPPLIALTDARFPSPPAQIQPLAVGANPPPLPPPAAAPSPPLVAVADARFPGAPAQIQPLAVGANPPPLPPPAASPSSPLVAVADAQFPVAPAQIQPLAVGANPPPLPLSPFPSSLPNPPVGLLTMKKHNVSAKPITEELPQENCYDTSECPIDYKNAIGSQIKDILHMCKNLLQQYAQKENLDFPVYTSEAEGPPHDRRFKSKVFINGKSYSTLEVFSTLKEAEQAAAKIACQTLSVDANQEDKGLYKNLLQEFALKRSMMCPSYETVSSGSSHKPTFVSTVEIGNNSFKGAESKTKKQAEINAAKVAYYALTQGCPPTNSVISSPTNSSTFAGNVSQAMQPTAPAEKHQAATDAEGHQDAKRAKSVPENADASPHPHTKPPSNDTTMESSTITEPLHEPTVANDKPSIQWKTVVFPRKLNRPIPENASVMPYSDDLWVAYRAKLDQKPTA